MNMGRYGWFADTDDEVPTTRIGDAMVLHPWQPVLQIPGMCLPLPAWFATEDECLAFIRTEVAGRGLLDEAR